MTALMRDCSHPQLVAKVRSLPTQPKVRGRATDWRAIYCQALAATFAFFALLSFCGTRTASAQVVLDVTMDSKAASGQKPVSSFSLPTQSSSVKEAIEEFQRFVENEAWEKAFESLETITSKATEGFVERPDGVLVPSRLLVRSLLAGMPTAGKSAYRVFYDAQATALWDKAVGAAEVDTLTQIVDNHLVSSVGDRAADRLGDLYFERGDLHRAQAAWRTVLNSCPESEISKAHLLIKVATALALAGRGGELGEIQRAIDARYANDSVIVAGRPVKAGDEIERLVKGLPNVETAAETKELNDFELPASDAPLWQFRYQTKTDPNNPGVAGQPFPITNVYGQPRPNDFRIPVATDGERVYLNTFGVEMAFDLASGKMLWRTGRMHDLNFQQSRQGVLPERYSIMVAGKRTWSVTRDPGQMNQQPPMFSLVSRDAATGKELFNSRRAMSTWSIVGSPLLARNSSGSIPGGSISQGSPASVVDRVVASAENSAEPSGKPEVDFSQGFAGGVESLSLNGKVAVVDSRLRLTDGGSKQVSSVFTTKPVSVTAFETEFEFQFTKAFADGIVFVVQGGGPKVIGDWNNGRNGISFEGIEKSVGVKFDIYGPDANSTGLCLDGVRPTADSAISFKGSKINLKTGRVFKVNMTYDGENLQVKITDKEQGATHSATYPVDIASHVGGPRAYVGFTGSSGLLTAVQDVLRWTYAPRAPRAKAPQPVAAVAGDVVYVGACRTNKSAELSVLEIDAQTFKLKRDVTLGTHAVDPNQVYFDRVSEPTFAMQRDRLYIDTHAGALVALRPETAAIEWGILYESPPPQSGYPSSMYQPAQFGTSGPLVAGGLLFAKGMRSPRVIALDPAGPTASWRRPISVTAVLVGADDKYLYTGGEELAAYDLQTQELAWSTRLPRSAGWSAAVLTKNRLYQFTSRGIYQVDKRTGEVMRLFRGADLDALGGSLFVTPTALVTVSNVAVTAYPLSGIAPPEGSASLDGSVSLDGHGDDSATNDKEQSAKR